MNETETKLSNICKKNKWFCQRLNTHTFSGTGTDQVSDFLVANNNGVYAIECKQRKELFNLKDLTQSLKMKKLIRKSNQFIPYIILNYYKYNKLYLFTFKDYLIIKELNVFKNGKEKKSFNHRDIPKQYLIEWNQLIDIL